MEQTIYIRTNEQNEIIETCSAPIHNGFEYKGNIDFEKLLYAKLENGQIVYDEIGYHKDKEQENKKARISELKTKLKQTDYKAIKYAEGQLTEEEYAPIKAQRQLWRDEINQLEQMIM